MDIDWLNFLTAGVVAVLFGAAAVMSIIRGTINRVFWSYALAVPLILVSGAYLILAYQATDGTSLSGFGYFVRSILASLAITVLVSNYIKLGLERQIKKFIDERRQNGREY